MELALLKDIIVICGLSLGVILICHKLGIPSIVGFLLTGILTGPHGLGLISQVEEVEHLAEIGVVCLLFTIGLEFSMKSLLEIKVPALVGGSLQVGSTVAGGAALGVFLDLNANQAVFLGFLIALSSTAIVLRLVQQRGDVESPHGRMIVGILIFQDIVVVPMMLLTPILAGEGQGLLAGLTSLMLKTAGIMIIVVIIAKWIVPAAFFQVSRLRDRELFFLGVVFVGLGVAWVTSLAGLSLALGAFLAGLIIADSEYGYRALGNVMPFRDFFTSFFFVSVGMLLDLRILFASPVWVTGLVLSVILIKFFMGGIPALIIGRPLRTAILTGAAICQIGEFSFVLLKSGLELKLIETELYQLVLGVSVLTMVLTPFLVSGGDKLANALQNLPILAGLSGGKPFDTDGSTNAQGLRNHLIIVGFGLNGKHVAKAAKGSHIPHVIIELNPQTVRDEKAKGRTIFYGDASHEAVLEHAGIRTAKVLVIVMSDPGATHRVIEAARRLNPSIYIISRTRFVTQMDPMFQLGADEVIPEDYEASVEVVARVLSKYLVPREDIEKFVTAMRSDHYDMLRSLSQQAPEVCTLDILMPESDFTSMRVGKTSEAVGKTLAEVDLRKKCGVSVLGIRRNAEVITNPSAQEKLLANDVLIVLGDPAGVVQAARLFRGN